MVYAARSCRQSGANGFQFSAMKKISPAPGRFCKLHRSVPTTLTTVKRIAMVISAALFCSGCSWFGPAEEYKTESGRTTYRAAEENPATRSEVTPAPQQIPGEKR